MMWQRFIYSTEAPLLQSKRVFLQQLTAERLILDVSWQRYVFVYATNPLLLSSKEGGILPQATLPVIY